MFCKHCGTENNSAFCTNCGARMEQPAEKNASSVFDSPPPPPQNQPQNQPQQGRPYYQPPPYYSNAPVQDKLGCFLGGLCFLFFPVGIILFFVWRTEKPNASKNALIISLVSLAINIVSTIYSSSYLEAILEGMEYSLFSLLAIG